MNPKVDAFLNNAKKWREEMTLLRGIVLECGLNEEIKWMHPCYTLNNANIVLIHGFKEYCALLFHKGVLIKDKDNLLVQQTENVQSARQLRFTHSDDIIQKRNVVIAYIKEAIEIEKTGLQVVFKKTREYNIPAEFKSAFKEIPELEKAFYSLTPGRQRAYLLYFSSAKQSATRESRIDKYIPKILDGKGLDD